MTWHRPAQWLAWRATIPVACQGGLIDGPVAWSQMFRWMSLNCVAFMSIAPLLIYGRNISGLTLTIALVKASHKGRAVYCCLSLSAKYLS